MDQQQEEEQRQRHLDDFIADISSLFHRKELSDLTLIIENQEVRVNRDILAARSDYFHALLYNGMKESRLKTIELPHIDRRSFEHILKFIYSGKLSLSNLSSEELADLLVSARFFCLERLICDIALYLRLHITKDNVWLLYRVAKSFYVDELAKACERFFDKNADTILQHDEFLHLDLEELREMVNRDSFFAPEKVILRAICTYYRNNIFGKSPSQCVKLLRELLEPVRLSLLSPSEIKAIFSEFKLPIFDLAQQEDFNNNINDNDNSNINLIYSEKHRSALPIRETMTSTKRPSTLKSPISSRKKLKLSSPLLTVASENQDNIQLKDCEVIVKDVCSKLKHFSTTSLLDIASVMRQRKESIRGYLVYNTNVATKEYKVEPLKGRLKKDLVCSADRNYNSRSCTNHTVGHFGAARKEYIQVAFGRPFIINSIRMLLLDDGQRSFSYIIEVSVDGKTWSKIIDYSNYWCRSWQHLFFKERVVKHVRITGTRSQFYSNPNKYMSVVYLDCMYNTIDTQMFRLTEDGNCMFKKKTSREYFIEPKSTVVEINNTIALTSSSNGTMRHFRLRAKNNSSSSLTANPSISTSPIPHLSTGLSSPADNSNQPNYGNSLNSQSSLHYRTTDFARGSANWNSLGKVTIQLAQPFKISSFAFKITPSGGSPRSHLTYNVYISNDLDPSSWTSIKHVTRVCGKDLTVVEFEAQIVTFIEIRSVDYPNLSHFSVKHFECPFIKEQN